MTWHLERMVRVVVSSPAVAHVLDRLPDPRNNARVVDRVLAVELGDVDRAVVDRRDHDDRGVVDQHVEAAKFADHVADQGRRLLGLA